MIVEGPASIRFMSESASSVSNMDERGEAYFVFLVRHHSLMHHMFRGEFPASALKDVLESRDNELFDAFFIFSFIMLSAIRDDLVLEDLAGQLFKTKVLCDRIIAGETSLEEKLDRMIELCIQ